MPARRRIRPTPLSVTALEDRVNPVGELDPTFNGGALLVNALPAPINAYTAVAVQADGKVVAAGTQTGQFVVSRFNTDGTPDTSFGSGGNVVLEFLAPDTDPLPIGFATGVTVLPSGSILVSGTAGDLFSLESFYAVGLLSASGTPLTSLDGDGLAVFNIGDLTGTGPTADLAFGSAVLSNGNVVLAGASVQIGGDFDDDTDALDMSYLVLTPAGAVVQAGRVDLGGLEIAFGVAASPDGGFFLAGTGVSLDAVDNLINMGDILGLLEGVDFASVKVNPNFTTSNPLLTDLGGLDLGFGVAVDSQGRAVIGGLSGNLTDLGQVGLIRLNAGGSLDTSFGSGGTLVLDLGSPIEAAFDVLIDGQDRTYLIGTTGTGGVTADQIIGVVTDVIGGDFEDALLSGLVLLTKLDSIDAAVARLTPDFQFDPTFAGDGIATFDTGGIDLATAGAFAPDGKLVIVGAATTLEPTVQPLVGRIITDLPPVPPALLVGNGSLGVFQFRDPVTGALLDSVQPFGPDFPGGVRVGQGDVTGDGVPDIIAATGPGDQRVIVYDGRTREVLADLRPFEFGFTGGVFVAAGDFTGDGKAELVVTADEGGGARVIVYDGASLSGGTSSPTAIADFLGLADFTGTPDTAFRGGARVAVGDINGDGVPELVVAAGFGGAPRVTIWDGLGVRNAAGGAPNGGFPIANFFAFEDTLRDGAFVAVGDVDGDGDPDLVFGAGSDGAPRVRVVDGLGVLAIGVGFQLDDPAFLGLTVNSFLANDSATGGIRVAARDDDGDGISDLVTGSGEGQLSEVRTYKQASLAASFDNPTPDLVYAPFDGVLADGIYVG